MATITRVDDTTTEFAEGTLTGVQAENDSLKLAYNPVLSFDGVDDYVDCPTISLGQTFTVEVKIKRTSNGTYPQVLGKEYELGLGARSDDGWKFFTGNGSTWGAITAANTTLQNDVVYHLTVVADNGSVTYYLDGVIDGTATLSYDFSSDFYFGMRNGQGSDYAFHGNIFELRFWNYSQTQAEVQNNMHKELTGSESGLVRYYKLDSGSGTTAVDSAGTNDGTINGATWVNSTYYVWDGNRITPNIDLSQENIILSSNIQWTATLNSQTLDIEARTSTDGGSTWSSWQACTNGSSIPGIQPNSLLQIRQSMSTTDMATTPTLDTLSITIETAAGMISGNVKEEGANVQRTVRIYLRSDGHLVYETTSDIDGNYTAYTATLDEHYAVFLDDTSDATDYNAIILDRITPGST